MAPGFLMAGAGEGESVTHGSGAIKLERPETPPGIHAPPPGSMLDVDAEEGEDMATNGERISALEEKMTLVVSATSDIPGIKTTQDAQAKKVDECALGIGQILACLQSAGIGTVATPATGGVTTPQTPPAIIPNNPTAQLIHYLMPALRQLPPQILLLFVAWLLFTGKLTGG